MQALRREDRARREARERRDGRGKVNTDACHCPIDTDGAIRHKSACWILQAAHSIRCPVTTAERTLIAAALKWAREADKWASAQVVAIEAVLCDWDLPMYRAAKRVEREHKKGKAKRGH